MRLESRNALTIRRSSDLESFKRAFEERLQSIAMAHGLLTRTDWEGSSLRDIIHSELDPRVAAHDQVSVSGPTATLSPKSALAMHMVIHEMATNAVKYGR